MGISELHPHFVVVNTYGGRQFNSCLPQEMFIGETIFTRWTIYYNRSTCVLLGHFESINM
jgi:hypothetical protein